MTDYTTPNLPAIDFEETSQFYRTLGFSESWRSDGWMILKRDSLTLEFFPEPDLKQDKSSFGCCLRLDNLDSFYDLCRNANIPETDKGWPRLSKPHTEPSGIRIAYLIDPNGSVLRLIQNQP